MKSKENKNIVYVKLEKGEEIMKSLLKIVKKYNINSGWINGIGLVENFEIGSYNLSEKDYSTRKFSGHYELTSLMGNITLKDKEPFLHIHVNLSDEKCQGLGGHLFSAIISAAGEFIIHRTEINVYRQYNNEIGLTLWSFDDCS